MRNLQPETCSETIHRTAQDYKAHNHSQLPPVREHNREFTSREQEAVIPIVFPRPRIPVPKLNVEVPENANSRHPKL